MTSHGSFKLWILFLSLLAGIGVSAENVFARGDKVPGSRYTSARGAALGDAFIPLADDGMGSLFYNPASFGKISRFSAELFNLSLQPNSDLVSTSSMGTTKFMSLNSFKPTLESNEGSFPGFALALAPSISMRGFGVGLLMQSSLMAMKDGDEIRYRTLYQIVPAAGFGIRLAEGIIRLGYSLQWVNASVADVTANEDEVSSYNEGLQRGAGISHNVGFAMTFPIRLLPAINVVARNVGGLKYQPLSLVPIGGSATETPADEEMSLDAAFSLHPRLGKGSELNFVAQYRDVSNTSGTGVLTRASLGMELNLRETIFLRAGFGSGAPSAGFGLKTNSADFSFAWFTEEIGTGSSSLKDTRFMLQFQIRTF